MYIVYAIKSEVEGRIYIGFTGDLERRLVEHNAGKTKSTKVFLLWKCIFNEEVISREQARKKREILEVGLW
ncbi:GIY-YIG nuclease family protein [Echinicola pacifica]|uniref:GIY-YIG nuclease family protein n=1 Tax=Echinicola pacifica TaxID=346377 RepID=UPI001E3E9BF5|nr:GIY-YIG nuclease family protein [Echinicola pacifica]